MSKNRMEAFSDGILAIIITIMVLKLSPPKQFDFYGIKEVLPTFIAYILSFVYVGIYWANHHHLVSTADYVSGRVLWKNLHWLFWMSLIPTATEWMGLNPMMKVPTFFYGTILFMCAVSYHIIQREIVQINGEDSLLAKSLGKDLKGKLSILAYAVAMIFAILLPWFSYLIYLAIAMLWIIPDTRVESYLLEKDKSKND